jgi:hypothetical protein
MTLNDPVAQMLIVSALVTFPVYLGLRIYVWRFDREQRLRDE